jgi:hypothetical protein
MSDGNQPQPAEPPVEPWHPALRALLFLVGFVLLLPGLCTVVLVFLLETNPLASPWLALWLLCLAISFGGVLLIRAAWRHRSS